MYVWMLKRPPMDRLKAREMIEAIMKPSSSAMPLRPREEIMKMAAWRHPKKA
jgi:hypothetical protein